MAAVSILAFACSPASPETSSSDGGGATRDAMSRPDTALSPDVVHSSDANMAGDTGLARDAAGRVDAGTDASAAHVDAATDASAARAIGTVSGVAYAASCGSSFGPGVGATLDGGSENPNFRCATLTVSCPGLADMTATVALSGQPPGTSAKGAIVTHNGALGTALLGGDLGDAWFQDGFNIAEVAWSTPWECPLGSTSESPTTCISDGTAITSRPGMLDAACRPATVFQWVHESAELPSGAPFQPQEKGFCGYGASAGSGAMWYSLLHYGLSDIFDHVVVTASTPFGRIDIGCNPAYSTATVAAPCSNLATNPQVPEQYDSNHNPQAASIDDWSSTTSCDGSPSTDELDYWARNSLVSPGAAYIFPTSVSTYDCVNMQNINVVPGMNAYLFDQLSGSQFKTACVLNGTNGSCSGEDALGDAGMLRPMATTDMEQGCTPLAR